MAILICISEVLELILGLEANILIFITVFLMPSMQILREHLTTSCNWFLKVPIRKIFPICCCMTCAIEKLLVNKLNNET